MISSPGPPVLEVRQRSYFDVLEVFNKNAFSYNRKYLKTRSLRL
jgi:hypothetical protein